MDSNRAKIFLLFLKLISTCEFSLTTLCNKLNGPDSGLSLS